MRIRLELASNSNRALDIDVNGDVIVGRGSQAISVPFVDLTAFDALELGVSRLHAVFHLANPQILIIDLLSKNGTYVNGIRVERNMAQVLHNSDRLTLGGLQFVLHLMYGPHRTTGMPPSRPPLPPWSPLPVPVIPGGPLPAESAHAVLHFEPDPDPPDADGRNRPLSG